MKKGFTLIELLAVIVILAIIALIAVPIVINIINDAKNSSDEQSVELYMDSVKKAIARKQIEDTSFNPTICNIQDSGNLLCGNIEVIIDMKGIKPNKGIIEIKDNQVTYKNLLLNGTYYNRLVTPVQDNNNNGKPDIGEKYTYKVNDTDTFNFYVLSFNDDDTVNLIMDRNICEDGTVNYTEDNNYCRYAWHAGDESNNNYGPDTAMTYLYNGTKGWTNVPDMIMNYNDESNYNRAGYGYKGIYTDIETKITTIVTKNEIDNTLLGNNKEPLKARLPKGSELSSCTATAGSCPVFLVENLKYYNVSNDKYSINNNSEPYQKIDGYWLVQSHINSTEYARKIYYRGSVVSQAAASTTYGIRPVITVPKSYLE